VCFDFLYFWNFSHFKRNSAKYYQKCTLVFMWSTRYVCQILMKLEFSRQIFEKYSDIKFHENPSSGSWVTPMRTDRRTGITKLILGYCNFCQLAKRKLVDRVLKALMTCELNVTDVSPRHGYISPSHSYKCVSEHLFIVLNVVTWFKIDRRYKGRVELKLWKYFFCLKVDVGSIEAFLKILDFPSFGQAVFTVFCMPLDP
jgi:hypothetical protein